MAPRKKKSHVVNAQTEEAPFEIGPQKIYAFSGAMIASSIAVLILAVAACMTFQFNLFRHTEQIGDIKTDVKALVGVVTQDHQDMIEIRRIQAESVKRLDYIVNKWTGPKPEPRLSTMQEMPEDR